MDDRLAGEFLDAALHLLDRQVVDVDGLAVCKVDDLEVSFPHDGSPPAVTRLLAGAAALVPRLSSRSGQWLRSRWNSLGVQDADRDVPRAIALTDVAHLGSAVELAVPRVGLLDRQPPASDGVEHRRMGELIGMRVRTGRRQRDRVLDVRLLPEGDRWVLDQLVVGPGRPGSLLGYDRGDFDGPWLVSTVVRHLHRHIRLVGLGAVRLIDWETCEVHLAEAEELSG